MNSRRWATYRSADDAEQAVLAVAASGWDEQRTADWLRSRRTWSLFLWCHTSKMGTLRIFGACVVMTGCLLLGSEGAWAADTAATSTVAVAPPAIHEVFTLLPCNEKNDLGIEGCEEHKIVHLDKIIDKAEQVLFTLLENEASLDVPAYGTTDEVAVAQRLSQAETEWFSYRVAECRSESDVALGGTEATLLGGTCEIKLDQVRLAQLTSFYKAMKGYAKKDDPGFPKG